MEKKLNSIRQKSEAYMSAKIKIFHLLFVIFMGCAAGFLAKFFDVLPYQQVWGNILSRFFQGIGEIGSMFSVWIFTAVLVSAFSRSPLSAGIHSFCYLFSMNVVYYIYQSGYYGLSYQKQFIFWSVLAVLSILLGAAVWYARGNGWIAAFLAALPVSALLGEGSLSVAAIGRFIKNKMFVYGIADIVIFAFGIISAIILLIVLPKNNKQRIKTAVISAVLYLNKAFRQK